MNEVLFRTADFLSRPPGFYLVLIALVLCTAMVPLGLTDLVTYVLSAAAIIIAGVVLIQGGIRRRSMRNWMRSLSRCARCSADSRVLSVASAEQR